MKTEPKLYFTDLPFKDAVLPKVFDVWNLEQYTQRTPEWYSARKNCLTASSAAAGLMRTKSVCNYYINSFGLDDFDLNPTKNCAYKESKFNYIMSKCGASSEPVFTGNEYTEWGQKYEPIATTIYSQLNKKDTLEFGLIIHPKYRFIGASPDGITTDGIMLEIKCPPCRQVSNIPPIYYFIQIMLQLHCTGLEYCDFMDAHFVEYVDFQDWKEAAKLWEQTNINANFHIYGLILKNTDTGDFIYPPPNIHKNDDFVEWMENIPEDVDITMYKLQEYYIQRVQSNEEWFETNILEFEQIWKEIEIYRKSPEALNEFIATNGPRKRLRKS